MTFTVQILVARRRNLKLEWRCDVPQRNYWRLWWNDRAGAAVTTAEGRTELAPDQVVLVAPRTPFSTFLPHPVSHFYLHFQLAAPFDRAAPGIYTVPVTGQLADDLEAACTSLQENERRRALVFTRLISDVCLELPPGLWQEPLADPRFARVLGTMEQHLQQPLSNTELARLAGMAPTAFVRRFRQLVGVAPQAWYLQKRLEQACFMLEYGDSTIDHIAEACGFCDRNYFSTVFRKKLGLSPAAFRRACHSPATDQEADAVESDGARSACPP